MAARLETLRKLIELQKKLGELRTNTRMLDDEKIKNAINSCSNNLASVSVPRSEVHRGSIHRPPSVGVGSIRSFGSKKPPSGGAKKRRKSSGRRKRRRSSPRRRKSHKRRRSRKS